MYPDIQSPALYNILPNRSDRTKYRGVGTLTDSTLTEGTRHITVLMLKQLPS